MPRYDMLRTANGPWPLTLKVLIETLTTRFAQ